MLVSPRTTGEKKNPPKRAGWFVSGMYYATCVLRQGNCFEVGTVGAAKAGSWSR